MGTINSTTICYSGKSMQQNTTTTVNRCEYAQRIHNTQWTIDTKFSARIAVLVHSIYF